MIDQKKFLQFSLITVRLALFSVILACTPRSQEIEVEYPVERIRINSSKEIVVYASKNVQLEDIIKIDVFKKLKLRPGVDIQEAKELLGEPDRVFEEYGGRDTIYGFKVESGEIQIVKQMVSSEGKETERWFLRIYVSYPLERQLLEVDILRYIPYRNDELWRVRVLTGQAGEHEAASIYVKQGKIKYLWWLA